jgi:hypothetical protein
MSRFLILLPVACLFGCGNDGFICESGKVCDSVGDTFHEVKGDQPPEVSDFTYSYTAKAWRYDVTLVRWGDQVTTEIYMLNQKDGKDDPWYEMHTLKQGDYDPGGDWDKYYADLTIVFDWSDQDDGISTMFTGDMEPAMSWMVTSWLGGVATNCIIAAGPQGDLSYWDGYGCDKFR